MRPEDLDVALRPRSSWEAMELGTALLRRHAGAVWRPWLAATLPLFALVNATAWALDRLWLAAVLMWWLKPVFDRIPLYVLSRGVFGRAPGTAETLRAQWRFGAGAMPGYLLWRRLGPARSLLLPVDLLEGTPAPRRRERRRLLGGPAYPQAALLTWTCWHFELALALAAVASVFMAVPAELLPASLRSFWTLLLAGPPPWLLLAVNAAGWIATSVVEPFYVAAGFGLYLNRRTETEAWDVELAFRRLRERLATQAAAPLAAAMLALCTLLPASPLAAQDHRHDRQDHQQQDPPARKPGKPQQQQPAPHDRNARKAKQAQQAQEPPATLEQVFGAERVDDASFRRAATRAYADPLLRGERTVVEWRRKRPAQSDRREPLQLKGLAAWLARLSEWALWIGLGVLLVVLALTAKRWLPWLRGSGRRPDAAAAQVDSSRLAPPEVLPDDIAATARRLWQAGRPRDALALLYRGSVEAMAAQAQVELPPGATEAHCLRASRQLPLAAARELFERVVRVWQYAAYAGRLPDGGEFEALLESARVQWSWRG